MADKIVKRTSSKRTVKFDVAVIGGGVAGFTAAVAAARMGAKTALVEDMGALGGIMTTGGNPEIGIFYAYYKQAIAGIGWELCRRLEKEGFADIPDFAKVDTRKGCSESNVKVNSAMAEAEMNNMCLEAGVKLFLHTKVIDAKVENGKVISVIGAEKRGTIEFEADVFVDCTGDGDVAYLCGAEQLEPDIMQPGTFGYNFLCKDDISKFDEKELRNDFNHDRTVGLIKHGDFWGEYHSTIKGFLSSEGRNCNHIVMDGSTADGMTKAEIDGRNSMSRMVKFMERHANVEVFPPAAYVAPRETKRTLCDYVVTVSDFLTGKIFEDSISYVYYNLDLHSASENAKKTGRPFEMDEKNEKLPDGIVPTIPYRAMTVKGLDNLLTAGRCISTERAVMGAARVKSACMAMGEAAGTAAALCKDGCVRKIDMDLLKSTLKSNGAIVPDKSIFPVQV